MRQSTGRLDWVNVTDNGPDTVVATSATDAADSNYSNLVTRQNVLIDLTTLEGNSVIV